MMFAKSAVSVDSNADHGSACLQENSKRRGVTPDVEARAERQRQSYEEYNEPQGDRSSQYIFLRISGSQ